MKVEIVHFRQNKQQSRHICSCPVHARVNKPGQLYFQLLSPSATFICEKLWMLTVNLLHFFRLGQSEKTTTMFSLSTDHCFTVLCIFMYVNSLKPLFSTTMFLYEHLLNKLSEFVTSESIFFFSNTAYRPQNISRFLYFNFFLASA